MEIIELNSASAVDRIMAGFIDLVVVAVCACLLSFILIGPILAFLYLIYRDALPFLDGQSLGKKLMKIRVISEETGKDLTEEYSISLTRNVPVVIPFFNVFEIVMLFTKDGKRYGDIWGKTKVIKE